jgi:CheY-like chemotaxis protein
MSSEKQTPEVAGADDARHARSAWLANKRQELLAPGNALLQLSEMLLNDAAGLGHEEFLADQRKVHASCGRLLNLLTEALDPAKTEAHSPEAAKRLHHDLRTPLNHVIGFCEMWLEDGDEELLERFRDDLDHLRTLGKKMLTSIDVLLTLNLIAHDPSMELPELTDAGMIHELIGSLPGRAAAHAGVEPGAVLVVDDNEINRDLLVRRLTRDGHTVTAAADGRQALDLVRARPFDVILLDIIMPELNGFQVLEQLKADERLRHIPVIMISAFDEIDSVVRCIEMGAEDYLTKPFNPVVLAARLGACLEKKRFRDREVLYLEQIEKERQRSDELLHVILPGEIVKELKETSTVRPRRYENVAVLFCDIVGFTPYCDANPAEQVVLYLQQLIEQWEESAVLHQVEKIKTIGDAFMAAAGLLEKVENPVLSCIHCGLEMVAATQALPTHWNLRVGIHVGPVVAGVIGKRQYLFDLWGDTVNTAARMESHGTPGAITLSGAAWAQVAHRCRGESRVLKVKGKSDMELFRFDGFLG